jgi:uncharacterized protein YggE
MHKEVDMSNPPTISVKGVGNVSVPPDMTTVTFKMSALRRDYEEAVNELNRRVGALRQALGDVGVERGELKTTDFDVSAEYEYTAKRREFKGWSAQHNLRLELPVDRERLNDVLGAIVSTDIESEIHICFEVGDKAGLRARVLEDATRTAQRNAEAIAAAAGCRLGKVLNIHYGWSEIRFESLAFERLGASEVSDMRSVPDIEPEDVDASDSVTVVWELRER